MTQKPECDPETWMSEYGDKLYRYALARVQSESTAEDLVQETLLAGLQSYHKFSGRSSVGTWLTGILKHKLLDYFRRKYQHRELTDEEGDLLMNESFDDSGHWQEPLTAWDTPEQQLDKAQFWAVFNQCLNRLPQTSAQLLLFRTLKELSTEQCCELLELNSANQLWVNLSRTRMRLRQCLEMNWFSQ